MFVTWETSVLVFIYWSRGGPRFLLGGTPVESPCRRSRVAAASGAKRRGAVSPVLATWVGLASTTISSISVSVTGTKFLVTSLRNVWLIRFWWPEGAILASRSVIMSGLFGQSG